MKTEFRQILIGWVLLLTLLPFHVVKALHHHVTDPEAACASSSHNHSDSDKGDCKICDFTLSPFTSVIPERIETVWSCSTVEPAPYIYLISISKPFSRGLRAPPAQLS